MRKQVAELFRQRVFPGLAGSALQPFLPVIMAYVHSGLTQLASDIRWAPALSFQHTADVAVLLWPLQSSSPEGLCPAGRTP